MQQTGPPALRGPSRRPRRITAHGKPFENKGGKPGGGKRFDKPSEDWKEHRPREERKPAVLDPNSPWAALAALRNPKSE